MSTLEIIAIVVGVLSGLAGVAGFFLGVANFWHQRLTTRPRVVVRLAAPAPPQQKINTCFVQICNVGQVPVRMRRAVGFQPKRGQKGSLIVSAVPAPGGKVTDDVELKPQDATILQCDAPDLPQGWEEQVFVESVIGDTFKVNRRDIRKFRKQLARLQRRPTPPRPATPCTSARQPRTPAEG